MDESRVDFSETMQSDQKWNVLFPHLTWTHEPQKSSNSIRCHGVTWAVFFSQVIKLPLVRLEMRYLSKVTGDEVFASKTMKFYVRILKLLALLDNLLFGKRNRIIITK